MTDYEALKSYGFSPAKAAEIALDASRGDKYALDWVGLAHTSNTNLEEEPGHGR